MMNFRTLKKNLTEILGCAANQRFRVVGYQQQGSGASEFIGDKRRVQVFAGSGVFSKGKGSQSGPVQHEPTFRIVLTVSAPSKGDLTVINNPESNGQQVAAAIAQFQNAAEGADESFDELFDIVYQILMDGRNRDIGTDGPPFIVGDRWISSWSKDEPINAGEYVAITGSIELDAQVVETITGDEGKSAGTGAFDITNDIDDDDNEKTGTKD